MADGGELFAPGSRVLISDFDGTMTEKDFFECARMHFAPGSVPEYWQQYLDGDITHFEALQQIFAALPGDANVISRIADETQLDPQIAPAIARLQQGGWEVVVASAGCCWYINHLLQGAGVQVPVISNPGEVTADGLIMSLPLHSPYYAYETGISKSRLLEHALDVCSEVAYAGDGRPDLVCARLVPPPLRFARSWLAEALAAEDLDFQRFTRWPEIADRLLSR